MTTHQESALDKVRSVGKKTTVAGIGGRSANEAPLIIDLTATSEIPRTDYLFMPFTTTTTTAATTAVASWVVVEHCYDWHAEDHRRRTPGGVVTRESVMWLVVQLYKY